jgi:hypothetical protein
LSGNTNWLVRAYVVAKTGDLTIRATDLLAAGNHWGKGPSTDMQYNFSWRATGDPECFGNPSGAANE